jgi:hypothetical protein
VVFSLLLNNMAYDGVEGINESGLKYLTQRVLNPIREANIHEASRATSLQCIGSPSGTQYLGAVVGQALSKHMMEVVKNSTAMLRGASDIFDGSQYVFLSDFIAAIDQGENDKKTLGWLRAAAGEKMDEPFDTLLIPDHKLVLNHGVPGLKNFFDNVLRPQLNPSTVDDWTWGDTAMVVIVITTCALWEERLTRLFEPVFLPKRALAAIADYVMCNNICSTSNDESQQNHKDRSKSPKMKPTCDFAPLLTLSALTILHASENIRALAVVSS